MLRRLMRRNARGQVLPLFAFGIFAMIGMASLAVDVGYWRYQQRVQQTAADSAAIAGGIESNYVVGSSAPNAVATAAANDAATNKFVNGTGGVTIKVNYPPAAPDPYYTTSADAFGKYRAVEVIITRPQPQFFSGIFGGSPPTLRTRAVAVTANINSDCVYALNHNATSSAGITLNGGGTGILGPANTSLATTPFAVYAPSCGVITDNVLIVNGGANIADQTIGFVNNASTINTKAIFYGGQPAPALAVQDPCPSIPSCNSFANAVAAGTLPQNQITPPTGNAPSCPQDPVTLIYTCSPGVYNFPITFTGGAVVNFAPGVYTLNFGLDIGGGATVTGLKGTSGTDGVTFYNAGTSSAFKMNGSGGANVYAPTASSAGNVDPFNTLVYYQNPANQTTVEWGGKTTVNLSGVSYMPGAELKLDGNAPSVTGIIANDIYINGGGMSVTGPNVTDSTRRHFVLAE